MNVARLGLLAALCVLPVFADVIDFENLPDTYMFVAGSQNIGTFYTGVDFEQNVTGLDLTGNTAYPAHSGSIGIWDPYDLSVTISFSSPQTTVGIWYTSFDPLTMMAFDSSSVPLETVVGAANTDGTTGTSDFVSVSASGISSITLTGSPGSFIVDDPTYTSGPTSAVPEPTTWMFLITAISLLLILHGRRHKIDA